MIRQACHCYGCFRAFQEFERQRAARAGAAREYSIKEMIEIEEIAFGQGNAIDLTPQQVQEVWAMVPPAEQRRVIAPYAKSAFEEMRKGQQKLAEQARIKRETLREKERKEAAKKRTVRKLASTRDESLRENPNHDSDSDWDPEHPGF